MLDESRVVISLAPHRMCSTRMLQKTTPASASRWNAPQPLLARPRQGGRDSSLRVTSKTGALSAAEQLLCRLLAAGEGSLSSCAVDIGLHTQVKKSDRRASSWQSSPLSLSSPPAAASQSSSSSSAPAFATAIIVFSMFIVMHFHLHDDHHLLIFTTILVESSPLPPGWSLLLSLLSPERGKMTGGAPFRNPHNLPVKGSSFEPLHDIRISVCSEVRSCRLHTQWLVPWVVYRRRTALCAVGRLPGGRSPGLVL